ncbi:MAG: hypothetical protein GTO02_13255, partial [Candidatus Dadabacteria bacterium]|nr:hypothetical protein [Candidatus Dadabacteria bacterium]NIQ15313.1 hypothetical protein [Candidatus Dadabacteria bacterium]
MKVTSPAGDFEITVSDSTVEDDHIVIIGQMGVWDSKIHMKPSDLWSFSKVILKPQIILFLIKQTFKSLFK